MTKTERTRIIERGRRAAEWLDRHAEWANMCCPCCFGTREQGHREGCRAGDAVLGPQSSRADHRAITPDSAESIKRLQSTVEHLKVVLGNLVSAWESVPAEEAPTEMNLLLLWGPAYDAIGRTPPTSPPDPGPRDETAAEEG